jgi:hypothetical protein
MAPDSLPVGGRFALGATALDPRDGVLHERHVVWTSGDPSVATITPDGVVTAVSPGHVELTCTCEGRTATVELTVEASQGASLPVDAPRGAAAARATPVAQAPAPVVYRPPSSAAESPPPRIEPPNRVVAGEVIDRSLAAKPVGTAPGRGITSRRAMTIGGAALLVVIVAVALASGKGPETVPDTAQGQKNSDSAAAAQGKADSVAREQQRPRDSIARWNDSVAKELQKKQQTIKPTGTPTVATVAISPLLQSLRVGDSDSLHAIVRDSLNNRMSAPVRWQSNDPDVASIDSKGKITANKVGSVVITAASGGRQANQTILVQPRTETEKIVTPPPPPPTVVGFTESVRGALAAFSAAIRTDSISTIRGKITQQLADDLGRRIAGARPGEISVTIRDIVADSTKATALFRMRIDDSARRPLLDFADFRATFSTSVRGWRLTSIDRIQ